MAASGAYREETASCFAYSGQIETNDTPPLRIAMLDGPDLVLNKASKVEIERNRILF
jgi:hypothetical protein